MTSYSLMSPWLDLSLDLQQQPSLFENANWDFVEPTSLAHFSSLLLTGVTCAQPNRSTRHCSLLLIRAKRHIGLIRWFRDYTLNLLPFFHSRSFRKYRPAIENAGTFHFPAAQNLPPNGVLVLSGTREILDSQIRAGLRPIMDKPGPKVVHWRKENGVHAWPMALYYLGRDSRERGEGISAIVSWVAKSCH
jgi:acetyl esterase/lipase